MHNEDLLVLLHTTEKLKNVTRHSYTSDGRRESVAEHSWRLAVMAYFVKDEFPEVDMDKVIRMCLIHDLGEMFTGDIPAFLKTKADETKESDLLRSWVSVLPEPYPTELTTLYREMDAQETAEARIYRALDGLEAVIQHNEAELSTWSENEYRLNLVYGEDRVGFSSYLTELRKCIREETEEKIRREKGTN